MIYITLYNQERLEAVSSMYCYDGYCTERNHFVGRVDMLCCCTKLSLRIRCAEAGQHGNVPG